ncbi:MAG: Ig-like domain-containing protein, partial [Cyclobacteriaceae bacterium]
MKHPYNISLINEKSTSCNKYWSGLIKSWHLIWGVALIMTISGVNNTIFAQATVESSSASSAQLISKINGQGVTITNGSFPNPNDSGAQYGTFSNGLNGASLSVDEGIILSTGGVTEAMTNNNQNGASQSTGNTYSDPDLTAINPSAIYDAAIFQFDVTTGTDVDAVIISYQFASEEYPDYVCSRFNDAFGFFVSGPGIIGTENIALVPESGNVVAVNSVNSGVCGSQADGTSADLTKAAYFIDNNEGTPGPVYVEYNGLTTLLNGKITGLLPNTTYSIKIAIADVADGSFDSGVVINQVVGLKTNADNDGLDDIADLDDDNDGIDDIVEAGGNEPNGDEDGDGLENWRDNLDNNGGGGDGSVTVYTDSNNDGIPDVYDTDSDGTPNHLDNDSDNDGCFDTVEAGHDDPDNDGILGTSPVASDGNGRVVGEGGYTGTNSFVTTPGVAGAITVQPVPEDIFTREDATFSVSATGDNLVYQWQQSINNGGDWTNLADGGSIPTILGATTNSLSLTSVPNSYDGYDYRLLITSTSYACTNLTSTEVNLGVTSRTSDTPVITSTFCQDAADFVNEVSGTTTEVGASLTIRIYTSSTPGGTKTERTPGSVVFSGNEWTASGLSIETGQYVFATIENVGDFAAESDFSTSVHVLTKTPDPTNSLKITSDPREGDDILEGEILISTTTAYIVQLYVDGIEVPGATANVPQGAIAVLGTWEITGLSTPYEKLYANGIATVTMKNPDVAFCESDPSAGVLIRCKAPATIVQGTTNEPTTCGGTDGSIQLTGMANSTTYTVNYTREGVPVSYTDTSNGTGELVIIGLSAGTYTEISVGISGCNSNELGPIILSDPATADISLTSQDGPTTCGGSDGTIVIDDNLGSSTSYTVNYRRDGVLVSRSISAVSGEVTIDMLSAATYTNIEITAFGCLSNRLTGPFELSDPTSPVISYDSEQDPASCSAMDGFIQLSIGVDLSYPAGTQYDYQYTYQGSVVNSASPITSTADTPGTIVRIEDLPAGTYTNISITGVVSGCQSNPIASVVLNPPDIVLGTVVDPTTCSGSDGSIEIKGLAASTLYDLNYDIDGVTAGTTTITSDTSGNYVIGGLMEGSYTQIDVTNNGCVSNALSATLSDPTPPMISLGTVADASTCGGSDGSIQLTGLSANTTYSVNYFNPAANTSTITSNGSGNLQISGLDAGTYTNISATITNCQSNQIPSVTINDPVLPTITLGADPTVCAGSTTASYTYSATSGGANQYSIDFDVAAEAEGFVDVTNVTLPSSPISIAIPMAAAPNTYNAVLTVSNTNTLCTSTGNAFTVTVNSYPTRPTINSLITNDDTPIVTGTADPGSTIEVVVGGATYSLTADGSGDWNVNTESASPSSGSFTPLTEGSHEVVASASNAGCFISDNTTDEITVDQTDPGVPTVESQTTNDTTPVLTGMADPGSTVTIEVAGATYVVVADGSGDWSVDTGAVSPDSGTFSPNTNGTNEVVVTSTDAAGNSSVDVSTGELVLDTIAPEVPTINPLVTNDTTPVITGTAEPGSTVSVVVGWATYEVVADGSGNWSVDTENDTPASGTFIPLQEGQNEIQATSTDEAGNSTDDTTTNEVTVDTVPPTAPTVSDQATSDTTPVITGTTGTGAALEAGAILEVTVNGATYNVVPDASGNWSVDTGAVSPDSGTLGAFVAENTYQVVAVVTDEAGNTATDSNTDELVILIAEICDNGIDDDGDGLIDCYDPDCYGIGNCADFFYGQNTPTCFNPPAVLPEFTLEKIYMTDSANYGFDQRSGVMIGDIDNDGISELVTKDRSTGKILIFNGINGTIKQVINEGTSTHQFSMVALGDVDSDGDGDIFVVEGNNSSADVARYEYDPAAGLTNNNGALWSTTLVGTRINYASPQLADFNEDGSPEVYVGANVINVETGALIAQDNTINSGRLNSTGNNGDRLPLAYNIFNDGDANPAGGNFGPEADGLEFIAGNQVYFVDFGTNSFTLAAEITGANLGDGLVSLGDLDNDNQAEIIVTSEGYLYAWNPRTETQVGSTYDIPSTSSGGKANVGDFDNDGIVDIGFAGSNRYIVLEYDQGTNSFGVKWQKTGLDDGSQRTGSTLYDFEGDGIAEVVYSEEAYLFILSGLDGTELARVESLAGTRIEYPLVADINDDGQAEIIVTAQEANGPGDSGENDFVAVYKSANTSWVAAREVWNQHGYHVTNVNDDLTIPQFQQDIFHPQFGGSLNGFLVQTTYVDETGAPTYATPDLVVTTASVNQNCGSTNNGIDISVTVQNQGDWKSPAKTPVTIYDADPYAGTANVIDTLHIPINLNVGVIRTMTTTVADNGQDFTLYVLVNHNPYESGTTNPIATPLSAGETNTSVNECDYTNNSFSQAITNCNSEPTITDVNVNVNEDNTYTFSDTDFSAVFTDTDGETIDRIQITSLPLASEGILYLSGVAVTALDEIAFADLGNITFEPVQDFNGLVTFGWNAHDGTEYALAGANINITVDPVNDNPTFTLDADNSGGGADDGGFETSFTEGGTAIAIADLDASLEDVDDTQMASVTIQTGGVLDPASEEIEIGGVTFPLDADLSTTATVGGTTFLIDYNSGTGLFTITNNAGGDFDLADANSLINGITYLHSDNDNPSAGDRTLSFTANDGDGNSNTVVSTITVVAQNDNPVAVDDLNNSVEEDGTLNINLITSNDTDVDGTIDPSTIILIDPTNASNTAAVGVPLTVAGVGTYTADASGNVTFTAASGYSGNADVFYTVEDNGGALSNQGNIGIEVFARPTITLGANPSVCEGSTNATLTFSATTGGADEYSIDYTDASFTDVVNAAIPISPFTLSIPGGTTEGVYNATLTVRNSTNGVVSDNYPITITIKDTPSIAATPTNPNTCSGTDGSIAISGVKNSTTYSVSYTKGGTTVNTSITSGGSGNSLTISGLSAGTYTNILVSAGGCPSNSIASVELSDPTPASISLVAQSNPSTCNGANGTITLAGMEVSVNYTLNYQKNGSAVSVSIMSDGSGNYTISGLTSGTYENFSVVRLGCTSNTVPGPVVLSDPAGPTIVYDSDQDPASCSSTDGFIILSSLTAGRDYVYSYTKNSVTTTGTLTSDAMGKIKIDNLPAGSYSSVFVDDAITGCQSNVIASIVLNPPDIVLGTVQNATTCSGTEGSIQITSLAANTQYLLDYTVDAVPVASATITANASGAYVISGLGAGSHTDIRFTNNGCVTNSLSTTITEPTPATIVQGTVTNPTTCGGTDGIIQITGLATSATYTVDYLDDAVPVSVNLGSNGAGVLDIGGLNAGNYTNITVTKDNCQSNAIAGVTLNDPVSPAITLGANPEECAGTSSTTIAFTVDSGSPNRYSIDFDAAANTAGFVDVSDAALPSGSINIAIGSGVAATYNASLTVTDNTTGCESVVYPITITIQANPTITLGANPEACRGDLSTSLTYSATSGSPDRYTIDFNAAAEAQGFVDVVNSSLGASPIVIDVPVAVAVGNYNAVLKVINSSTGCESTNTGFQIVINQKPTITLGANPEVCQGETSAALTYSATTASPDQYSISFSAAAKGAGFVDVSATNLPVGQIDITVPGAVASGNYNATVNVINSTTGCISDSKSIIVIVNPTPDITLGGNIEVCAGTTSENLSYSSLSGGADQYSIDFEGTAEGEGFTDVVNASLPSSPIVVTIPSGASMGTYNASLIVTNSSTGCISTSKAFTVTINDNPTFTLGANPEVCKGETAVDLSFTTSAGSPDRYTINFNSVAEGQGFVDVVDQALGASPISIVVPAAAAVNVYNATITFNNSTTGCSSSASAFTLKVNANPTLSIGADPEFCEGETSGNIPYSATTGSPDLYSIDFADAGFTDIVDQPITPGQLAFAIPGATTDGSYAATVTVKNSTTGCESAGKAFNVIIKNTPVIGSSDSGPSTCSGTDGSITLTGLSDAVTYTLSYNRDGSPVSTTVTPSGGDIVISNLPAGSYTDIKVTEDGCDSNTINITLNDPATASISSPVITHPNSCGGNDGNITIDTGIPSAITYTVDYLFNSAPVSRSISSDGAGELVIGTLEAGQYENIEVSANSCESNVLSGPFNLTDPTAPTISFSNSTNTQPATCGAGGDGVIVLFGTDNNTSYDYQYTYKGSTVTGTLTSENVGNQLRITGLNAGTYTDISVTIASCQSNTLPSIILNPPDISLGTTTDPTTCGGTEGSIQIVGFAASTTYALTYELDGTPVNAGNVISDSNGEYVISNLAAGAYTNIIAENNGCPTSPPLSATLTDPAAPVITEGTHVNPTTCGGNQGIVQMASLNASTAYMVSYTIDGTTTTASKTSNGSGVINITGLGAGSYTNVTASLNNCESNALAVTLSDPAKPAFTIANTTPEVCEGTLSTTLSYTVTSGSADTYSITFDGTATAQGFVAVTDATLSGGNITLEIPDGASPNSYSAFVRVKNTSTGCESSAVNVSLLINTEPIITLSSIPEICLGETTALLSYSDETSGTDLYDITFDADAGGAGFISVFGQDLTAANPISITVPGTATPGTYNAIVNVENSANGCVSQGYPISIVINDNPDITLGTNPEVCAGETSASISYSATANSPDQYTIDYDVTAEGQGFVDVATTTLPVSPIGLIVPAGAVPGIYNANLIVSNSSTGCESTTKAFTVTIHAYPSVPTVDFQVTNNPTPVITGDADNGTNVTIIVGGATYTQVAGASGWSVDTGSDTPDSGTFSPNTNGTNEVQVSSELNGCSVNDSSSDEIIIDTTSPAIPTVDSQVTNNTNPTLTGKAEAGSTVTVEVGTATFIVTANASGNWSVDTNVVPNSGTFTPDVNGANEVVVTSTDNAGNSSSDVTNLELVIDTTPPNAPTVANQVTNDTTPVIAGTAEPGSTVTIVVAGATYITTANAGGNWSIDTELVAPNSGTFAPNVNGANEVAVTSTDEAGNSTNDITNLELVIDTTPPNVPTVVSQVTNDPTPELSGKAEANSTVTVVVGGATFTTTADGLGDWTIDTGLDTPVSGTFNPNVNGTNEVTVTSTDEAGNSTNDITSLELTIDTTAPEVPTVQPQVTNNSNPTLTGTAEPNSSIEVTVGGAVFITTADAGGNWSVDTNVAPDSGTFSPNLNGTNEVEVTSTDEAGNSTSDISTGELVIDTTAPAIPTVNELITNDPTPILNGTAEFGSTVLITVGGAVYETVADGSGNWVLDTENATPNTGTFSPDVNGANEVEVTSTDKAGNSTNDATTLELTIDTTAPTVAIDVVAGDDIINAVEDDSPVTISGTTAGVEDGQLVTIDLNGQSYSATVTAGTWSVDIPAVDAENLAQGTSTITADVSDVAGNPAPQATRDIVHDSIAPTLAIDVVAGDDIINAVEDDSPVTISGTTAGVEDGQLVTINLNGEVYSATVTAGTWSVDIPALDAENLAQGTSTITADVNDVAGNPATQATRDIVHDSIAPTLAIDVVAGDDIINAVEDDSPVTVSGTTVAEDGQVVTIDLNGQTYSATVTAGVWSVDIPAVDAQNLAQGTSTITADVSDVAGNPATQSTRDIVHDSIAPTLTIDVVAGDDIINAVEDDSP